MNKKDSGLENLESRMLLAFGEKTLKKLAEKLEVNYYTLRNYAKGDRDMPNSLLEKIAKMSINLNWLLTGEGVMKIEEQPTNLIQETTSDSADEEEFAAMFYNYRDLTEEDKEELRGLMVYVDHEITRRKKRREKNPRTADPARMESTRSHKR